MRAIQQAVKWLAVPIVVLPGIAKAEVQFTEFRGVAEQLAVRGLAIDCDWTWASLALIVVVVGFWANHFIDRRK